jgi:Tol biopolymer transport system component
MNIHHPNTTFLSNLLLLIGVSIIISIIFLSCEEPITLNRHIENPIYGDKAPSWSPDGTLIAFYREEYDEKTINIFTSLLVIDTGGNSKRLLFNGYAVWPDWSPDGNWIAFSSGAIYMINLNGDSIRKLTQFTGHFPTWSPNGQQIACGRSGSQDEVGIWITDVQTLISDRFDFGGMQDWSPDGDKFVYSASPNPYTSSQIFIKKIQNKDEKTQLSNNQKSNYYPKWSPDGELIVWTVSYKNTSEIWMMGKNGQNQRKIIDGSDPSWAPNSKCIVYSGLNPTKAKMVLWKINIDGTNLKRLTF